MSPCDSNLPQSAVHTITVIPTVIQCSYEEQRGDAQWVQDVCTQTRGKRYDPPASAFGADGFAQGWQVVRMLLKKAG